jgi:hypothetical protein
VIEHAVDEDFVEVQAGIVAAPKRWIKATAPRLECPFAGGLVYVGSWPFSDVGYRPVADGRASTKQAFIEPHQSAVRGIEEIELDRASPCPFVEQGAS